MLYLSVIGITKVSENESDLQTHSRSSTIIPLDSPYMISYLSSINYVSILHRFWDIIGYFWKFNDVTWPWPRQFKEQFVMPMLNRHLASHCTKFDVSSFSHSRDIVEGTKNLNRSRNHNHAPLGVIFHSFGKTWYSLPVYIIWNLYVDILQIYERRQKI